MTTRVSTFSTFGRVLLGLRQNQWAALRAEAQISSGKRILRASDDPAGTARALALRRGLARSERLQEGVGAGRGQLDLAASTLQTSSELMSRARELIVQSMSGTLNADDRATIASELEELRKQLLDHANLQRDGSHVFGGTAVGRAPFVEVDGRVVYRGNGEEQLVQAGEDALVGITAIGSEVFGGALPGPARFDGLTGVQSGTTADEGLGYAYLVLRHDATDLGSLAGTGIALVDGGDHDTLLGENAITIDAAARTIQLGGGPPVTIPDASERGDVVVQNEKGGELHLDLTGWDGLDHVGSVSASGSISLDGDTFTALTFGETDLELADGAFGHVLHLDTRGVLRAGQELVTFGDTVNAFDLLAGVVEDLRNAQGLDSSEIAARLGERLDVLDGVHDRMLVGLGVLGARSARLASAEARQGEVELQLRDRLSDVEDADLSEAAIDLARSQMILEVAQAAGVRVLQTSLLDYLR